MKLTPGRLVHTVTPLVQGNQDERAVCQTPRLVLHHQAQRLSL